MCKGDSKKVQELQLLMVNPTSSDQVAGSINGTSVHFMPDTGASVTLLRKDVWEQVKSEQDSLTPWTGPRFVGVEGTTIPICGTAKIPIQFAGQVYMTEMVVADSLKTLAIYFLGLDFFEGNHCIIGTCNKSLKFQRSGTLVGFSSSKLSGAPTEITVVLSEIVSVPVYGEVEAAAEPSTSFCDETWMVEDRLAKHSHLEVANTFIKPCPGGLFVIQTINPTMEPVTVYRGTKVAIVVSILDAMIAEVKSGGSSKRE